jgi:hypothetical protein
MLRRDLRPQRPEVMVAVDLAGIRAETMECAAVIASALRGGRGRKDRVL